MTSSPPTPAAGRITRAVIHKHGLGSVVRTARVSRGSRLTLNLRQSEVDEVLKSLTVEDPTGQVPLVTLEPGPSARRGEPALELSGGEGLFELLNRLAGAEVRVEAGDRALVGRLIGAERVASPVEGSVVAVDHVALLSDGGLHRLPLSSVGHVAPVDPQLARDLERALRRLDLGRSASRRRLTIEFRGEREREVELRYTLPSRRWWTSYRLIAREGAFELRGFALVDNDTDEDWREVELALVAARPMRAAPQVKSAAEASGSEDDAGAPFELAEAEALSSEAASSAVVMARQQAISRRMRKTSSRRRRQASAAEREEGFRYEIASPVSITSGGSAVVPVFDVELEGHFIALYDEEDRPLHPMAAVRLVNTSDRVIEAGATTLYRDGDYIGEASLGAMRPGEEQLLPFAVELGCRVNSEFNSTGEGQEEVSAGRGYLFHTTWTLNTTTYTVTNDTARDLLVYLEHPSDRHAEYAEGCEPSSRGVRTDRFELARRR